jgi:DNA-binding response OmpR family regulator
MSPAVEPIVRGSTPIHVLLVEDEFLISEWMADALSEQGFVVQTATNGADALRQIASEPVDVLFTDINLLGSMDGADLARHARRLQPNIPVVYASARLSLLEPRARVPGAFVVPKPYEPAQVGRLLVAAMKSAAACVTA